VGLLYGLVAILGITPCLGFGMLALPFQPPEFATGLALFCVVPTTLGVGVALTAVSKGNQALALLLTVATNLLGIVTVGDSDTLMHSRHAI
jgi:sodium/bile acid cotransporter 7